MQFNTSYLWGVPSFEQYQERFNPLPMSDDETMPDAKEDEFDLRRVPPITEEDLVAVKTITNQYGTQP